VFPHAVLDVVRDVGIREDVFERPEETFIRVVIARWRSRAFTAHDDELLFFDSCGPR
jgi:hypothetical protein